MATTHYMNGRLKVFCGDITTLEVDAIVNAANSSLMGGGGVDGAIHRAAGGQLKAACRELRRRDWPDGLPAGEVALTEGFALSARYVIHTVGPVYARGEDRSVTLAACYRNALALARRQRMHTLAFPAISTGVYGYPFEAAAEVVLEVMAGELAEGDIEVGLCFFSADDARAFDAVAQRLGHDSTA
ncbi:O-acetyl-ADP-ribose deacetylase [Kushneria aurantia]|uniref:O-acetyl-ADP-ribose deacetylase n=1 Tax=Kushneria aurantia TaxID=504092 RepID=A0ABV6G1M6_9GAMM|nr:O-acetyl-ADP-ribose deacetylase [Kushneria aurantia]